MRISDWSSDVCSSDLPGQLAHAKAKAPAYAEMLAEVDPDAVTSRAALAQLPVTRKSDLMQRQSPAAPFGGFAQIGRASCRERVCQYVEISVGGVALKNKITTKITVMNVDTLEN